MKISQSIIIGFICGSIPWGYIFAKLIKKIDIRQYGSGNIGATNVWRVCGKNIGLPVFILDLLKGFVPVFLIKNFYNINYAIICGLFSLLGHTFTPWLKFNGGKGIATGIGIFFALTPKEATITLIMWVVIVLIFKYVSLASILASLLLVILIFINYRLSYISLFVLVGFVLVAFLHRKNIIRLIKGTEPKIQL